MLSNDNSHKKLNIIFAGTPEFAAEILKSLLNLKPNQYNLTAVYTQPDRPSGRGRKITASAVKQVALDSLDSTDFKITIEQPENFKNPDIVTKLKTYKPDLLIVVAYGIILPQAVLDIPKYGCINIHASLLPRWRGAAPIQRAILAGDKETGITIQQMELGLDTGPVINETRCEISNTDTTVSLTDKLLKLAINILPNCIESIINNNTKPVIQDNNLATYAHKLAKSEGVINWSDTAENIDRKIRALNPWPSATSSIDNNIFKILEAKIIYTSNNNLAPGSIIFENNRLVIQTGNNQIEIIKLQFSGGRPVGIKDLLNSSFKDVFLKTNF